MTAALLTTATATAYLSRSAVVTLLATLAVALLWRQGERSTDVVGEVNAGSVARLRRALTGEVGRGR
jgi:hypothetical protein